MTMTSKPDTVFPCLLMLTESDHSGVVKTLNSVFIRFRIFCLSRFILLLSFPFLFFSCRNIYKSSDGKPVYQPRTDLPSSDTILADTAVPDPVFYDPRPQCDYGVIYIDSIPDPVYFDPVPVAEYGVYPDLTPDE